MSEMVYQWKPRFNVPVDAQVAGEELERLRVRNNGQLTPPSVVRAAEPEDSPLHPAFEWDDEEAAQKFREDQARYMLRGITVSVERDGEAAKPIRAFVNVEADDDSRGYIDVITAMSDKALRQQVLARAKQELDDWRNRYNEYAELAGVFEAIDRLEGHGLLVPNG